jgi:hypothetical protein
LNPIFLAKKKEFFDLGVESQSFKGRGDRTFGSVISSHCIERNLHQITREITG